MSVAARPVPTSPWSVAVAFSRPHTIVGTVVAVVVLYLLATLEVGGGPGANLPDLVLVLVSAVSANVFIVGVNQLTDVDIDRINKPWLPLAAGTMSLSVGRVVVAGAALVAVVVGAVAGPWMLAAAVVGLVVGAAYSLPPLRLKRFHVAAAVAISVVRALVVNLFVFAQFQDVLVGTVDIPVHVWVLTGMVLGLTVAIAWFKDLPDAEGDARHHISTLVLVQGPRRVLGVGLVMLAVCYATVVVIGLGGLSGVSDPVLVVGHAVLLVTLAVMGWRVDLEVPDSIRRFYGGIWRLFVVEYLVFAVAALVG